MDVYLKKSCLQNIYSVRLFTEYLFRQQLIFFRQSKPPVGQTPGRGFTIYFRVCSKHKLFSNGNSLRFCRPINRRA